MKGNPFVRYAAALITGIVLYVYLPDWTVIPLVALLAGLGLLLWGIRRTRGKLIKPIQLASGLGGLLLLIALGWGISYQRTARNQSDNLIHLTDTLRAYEGVITAQPEERAKTFRVELAIRRGKWTSPVGEQWQPLRLM